MIQSRCAGFISGILPRVALTSFTYPGLFIWCPFRAGLEQYHLDY